MVPVTQTVLQMQAESIIDRLAQPANDPNGLMQIPDIRKSVEAHTMSLVQSGTPVTQQIVENLRNMALGAYMSSNKLAGGVGTGFALPPKAAVKPTAPIPANDETARAIAATMGVLKSQLPSKGKKS
jgi:hypothetical protein